jgi:hypothetical protein
MSETADSPVIFQRRNGAREFAMLGVIDVGEIIPAMTCVPGEEGLVIFKLSLPYAPVCWSRAVPIETARRELRRRIEHWLEAAGLASIARPPDGAIRSFRDWDAIKQAVRP